MKTGDIVGQHYEIVELIGEGGMAKVFHATHRVLGSAHAIKILHPHLVAREDIRRRFLLEGQLQAQLHHPYLVRVTDVITDPGVAGLVMEYLQGEDLQTRLQRDQPSWEQAQQWMLQLLEVLSVIHERGVVHRDVKPANIFLTTTGDQEAVRLLDFGIAQNTRVWRQTQTGLMLGTPDYMPPEQRQDATGIDQRADLYAAGAVLYELLLGPASWRGTLNEQDMEALPKHVVNTLRRALASDPNDRFADAQQFAAALRPNQPADTPSTNLSVQLDTAACATLAAAQNQHPLVRAIRVSGTEAVDHLTLRLSAEPAIFQPWQTTQPFAGGSMVVDATGLEMDEVLLCGLDAPSRVTLTLTLSTDSAPLCHHSQTVTALPANHWPGMQQESSLLAAFVRPEAPEVAACCDALLSVNPSAARTATAFLSALWADFQHRKFTLSAAPAGALQSGLPMNMPSADAEFTPMACCAVMAAVLERAGFRPLIAAVDGGALLGVWSAEQQLPTPTVDDPTALSRGCETGALLLVDVMALTTDATIEEARTAARRCLEDVSGFRFALDLQPARSVPISALRLPNDVPLQPSVAPSTTEGRLHRWKNQLLDLTLRNRLLNFRPSVATITLSPHLNAQDLASSLCGGTAMPILATADTPQPTTIAEDQQNGRLTAAHQPDVLQRRALELYRRANSSLQESGANTLYLALGQLTWREEDSSTPLRHAPLLLMPIRLVRPTGNQPWKICVDGALRINNTLLQKLEHAFSLPWTGLTDFSTEEADSALLLAEMHAVMASFSALIEGMPEWSIDASVMHIARFSFTRFVMWRDLDARMADLQTNPVLRHLLEANGDSLYPLNKPLVPLESIDARDPAREFTPLDADPTQLQAIFAAEDGNSFVLQGPPGTGKSQTITNMIAALLARGKSVLFVSEKMAALDVVHARLRQIGLGPFSLQLHSHKASRKETLHAIAAPLLQPPVRSSGTWISHNQQLSTTRKKLNRFAALLRTPTPFGETFHGVLSRMIALREAPRVELSLGAPQTLTAARLQDLRDVTVRLQTTAQQAHPLATHPWAGVGLTVWTPRTERKIRKQLDATLQAAMQLQQSIDATQTLLKLPLSSELNHITQVRALTAQILQTAALPSGMFDGEDTAALTTQIEQWCARVNQRTDRWSDLSERYAPDLLKEDTTQLHQQFARWSTSFVLFAMVMLWSARRRVKKVMQTDTLPSNEQITADLHTAVQIQEDDQALSEWAPQAQATLGALWSGVDTNTDTVSDILQHAQTMRPIVSAAIPPTGDDTIRDHVLHMVANPPSPDSHEHQVLSEFGAHHDDWLKAWETLCRLLKSTMPSPATLREATQQLQSWQAEIKRLRDWTFFHAAQEDACSQDLTPLVDAAITGAIEPSAIVETFEHSFCSWWWDVQFDENPQLQQFRGEDHDALIKRFQSLEQAHQTMAQAELQARLYRRLPDLQAATSHSTGEAGLLRRQLELQRRHLPIRALFQQIPQTIRRLKPCMLMSPLSVAQYLDPALERFDVVIFDEASQIPPWDALGAIARGNQVIIVGDSKQLPPTRFFQSHQNAEDDDEGMFELESILQEAATRLPNLKLQFHYRSQHESLISFSNHHYYDGRLKTFPSANQERHVRGVSWRHVPNGVYDRGRSRTNRIEAQAMVDALRQLLLQSTDQTPSIGVVTFSLPQQRLIEDLIDDLRQRDPIVAKAFAANSDEPIFIKNLENVQGDERDIILLGICYGPDANGHLTVHFGPLNRTGGERRLNVAITRARKQLVVFSSIQANHIDLNRTNSVGVRHLKSFLQEAAMPSQPPPLPRPAAQDASNAHRFADTIRQFLNSHGWQVSMDVGRSEYRVDLAVVDPEHPRRFLLGVLCDDEHYHSCEVARERDRLRMAVLEQLGWTLVQVWSVDWWLSPEQSQQRLLAALKEHKQPPPPTAPDATSSVTTADEEVQPSTPPSPPPSKPTEKPSITTLIDSFKHPRPLPDNAAPFSLPDFAQADAALDFYAASSLPLIARHIETLVAACGPIHRRDVDGWVAKSWGYSRLGARISRQVQAALDSTPSTSMLVVDDWLWSSERAPESWRGFRIHNADQPRLPERVCVQEVANLAEWVLDGLKNATVNELVIEVCRLLGYSARKKAPRALVEQSIKLLTQQKRLNRRRSRLSALD